MKITNLQNTRSFKGLNIEKVAASDMEKVIVPCLKKLRSLAKKADIEISSSTAMQEFEHFKSPRPVLNISVNPFNKLKAKIATSNYSMVVDEKNIKKHTILDIVKSAVKLI